MSSPQILGKGKLSNHDQNFQSQRKCLESRNSIAPKIFSANLEQEEEKNDLLRENRKQLKRKDTKIGTLQQKLKQTEDLADSYKTQINNLEYNLNFYKARLHEQCKQRATLEEQIIDIGQALKVTLIKLQKSLENVEQCSTNISISDFQSKTSELGQPSIIWKLIKRLEISVENVENSLMTKSKTLFESSKNMVQVLSAQIEKQREKFQLQRIKYFKKIHELTITIEHQKSQIEEKNKQIAKLRSQGDFQKQMLVKSQKQRMKLLNDVYKIGKKKYDIDFSNMEKAQVSKICLMLYSRIEELEQGKQSLQKYNEKLQTQCKDQYTELLHSVKSLKQVKEEEKVKPKKKMMRKLQSLPVE